MAYVEEDTVGAEAPVLPVPHEHVLAAVRFGRNFPAHDPPLVSVPLDELGGRRTLEVWYAPEPVETGRREGIDFARSGKVVFGHARQISVEDDPEDAYDLYCRVFALMAELGYPHVCRMWNYLPDINGERAGLERYRLFCRGRHRALAEVLRPFEPALPAASAIGTRVPGLLVCFLAAVSPGEQVENPRQVSAFRYPAQYGPKSPSFSRSILKSWGAGHHHLYISGMASIVGHATRHIGDFARQLAETCDNLESLLKAANGRCGERLRLDRLRVYLRDGGRAAEARAAIDARLGPVPMLILQGDLCRADLLIEVEGLAIGEAAPARN
jgi:chorismate lyase/3-hydroxybenzoate synthase